MSEESSRVVRRVFESIGQCLTCDGLYSDGPEYQAYQNGMHAVLAVLHRDLACYSKPESEDKIFVWSKCYEAAITKRIKTERYRVWEFDEVGGIKGSLSGWWPTEDEAWKDARKSVESR